MTSLAEVYHGARNESLRRLYLGTGLFAAGALYWDASLAGQSRLRARFGWRGVRIAWVALAAFLVAGIGTDLFGSTGANLLFPVHDAYYRIDGRLVFSTQEGIVQTFVALGAEGPGILPLETVGTTASHAIPTFANPDGRPGLSLGADRELSLVRSAWQLVVVAAAVATLAVRFRRRSRSLGGDGPEVTE
jgi:hypothetical protein